MDIVSFTFINRYSKTRRWLSTPRSFRDVIMPENGTTFEQVSEFDIELYKALLKCNGVTTAHTLPSFINVQEKKMEVTTPWYKRALVLGDSETDLVAFTAKLDKFIFDLDDNHPLKKGHDIETNDLRNSIWAFTLDGSFVLLTYNKNVVRRIESNFKGLADQHILELNGKVYK